MKIFISIFFILTLIILTSKLRIDVISLNKKRRNFKVDFNMIIKFCLFGIIRIKLITLNEDGIYFLFFKIPYEKINMPKYNMQILKEKSIFEVINKLNLKFEKINFKLLIGIENVIANAFFIAIVSSMMSIISGKNSKKIDRKKYYYEIIPIYNSNMLEFDFQTRISIRTINIIKTFIFISKNKESENQKLYKEILVKI